MNAVFEPSLLFIADEDWHDEEKRDTFIDQLIEHLDMLDQYDLCKIWWTDELQTLLVETPQMHPWYQSDQRNQLIAIIHHKFYNRIEELDEYNTACTVNPSLTPSHPNPIALSHFLKLIHSLIEYQEDFHLCVGLANRLKIGNYSFSCSCHEVFPKHHLLNQGKDWLQYIDVVAKFFPKTIEEFDEKFELGMEIVRQRDFEDKPYLYGFEFTKKFKKSIIHRTTNQLEIFTALVKKLVLTPAEAGKSDLKDEWLKQTQEYRFRVTQRPSSTRMHYKLTKGNRLIFICYYGEGEHDAGL